MKNSNPQRNFQSDVILKNKKVMINPLKKQAPSKSGAKEPEDRPKEETSIIIDCQPNKNEEKIPIPSPMPEQIVPIIEEPPTENSNVSQEENAEDKTVISQGKFVKKIEPVLSQKKAKPQRDSSQNSSRTKNDNSFRKEKEVEFEKKKVPEQEQKNKETPTNKSSPNIEAFDLKKFAQRQLDDAPLDLEASRRELREKIKSITSKTFLSLKNLIKPQENIRIICVSFVGLFGSNLPCFTEDFYSSPEIKEWSFLQKFFESPGQLLNLLAKFEELVDQSLIVDTGVRFTAEKLKEFAKISSEENQDFNFEVIRLLAEFLSAAVRYYRSSRINELSISPIKQVSEVNTSMALPNKSPLQETPAPVKTQPEKPEKSVEIIEQKAPANVEGNKSKTKERGFSNNNSKLQKEKLLAERNKEINDYVEKKRGMAKKNKLERIMNLKVKKPSVPSVIKDYLNKSSEFQDSFSKKKKTGQSFNGSTSSFHDEIKKAEKEIRELEAAKTRIVLLYEKQKKKDTELEESQRLKDLVAKQKEDEIKMKELLKQKKREEREEISSFRKDFIEKKKLKSFEEGLRNKENEDHSKERERELSIKKEQEEKRKNKKREESNEKLQDIQFIRETKKKKRELELKNQTEEYLNCKDEKLKQKKKEILQMKENLENELFQTLQKFQKETPPEQK